MQILPNISRSKGNQTIKFGWLIEYNLRKIFFQKSYTKCAAETIPRPLSKISKLSISLDQQCKVLNSLFLQYANFRAIEIQINQAADHLVLPNIKLFLKKEKADWNQFPCLIFCIIFKEKYFSWDTLLNDQISLSGCL